MRGTLTACSEGARLVISCYFVGNRNIHSQHEPVFYSNSTIVLTLLLQEITTYGSVFKHLALVANRGDPFTLKRQHFIYINIYLVVGPPAGRFASTDLLGAGNIVRNNCRPLLSPSRMCASTNIICCGTRICMCIMICRHEQREHMALARTACQSHTRLGESLLRNPLGVNERICLVLTWARVAIRSHNNPHRYAQAAARTSGAARSHPRFRHASLALAAGYSIKASPHDHHGNAHIYSDG